MTFLKTGKEAVVLAASCTLLVGAWVSIAMTFRAVLVAVGIYGFSITQILLDAQVGYLGLISVGLSSSALILASSSNAKANHNRVFKLFRATFFSSLLFLVPTLFSIVLFLTRS